MTLLWCVSVAWGLLTHGHTKLRFTVFLSSGTLEGEAEAPTLPLSPGSIGARNTGPGCGVTKVNGINGAWPHPRPQTERCSRSPLQDGMCVCSVCQGSLTDAFVQTHVLSPPAR